MVLCPSVGRRESVKSVVLDEQEVVRFPTAVFSGPGDVSGGLPLGVARQGFLVTTVLVPVA